MEKMIVNSIESFDHDEDLEMKECVKQLKASKQEIELVKVEELLVTTPKGAHNLSIKGDKIPELKELPSHLKYVFLSKDAFKPAIISSTLTPLEDEKLMRVLRGNEGALGWNISDFRVLVRIIACTRYTWRLNINLWFNLKED